MAGCSGGGNNETNNSSNQYDNVDSSEDAVRQFFEASAAQDQERVEYLTHSEMEGDIQGPFNQEIGLEKLSVSDKSLVNAPNQRQALIRLLTSNPKVEVPEGAYNQINRNYDPDFDNDGGAEENTDEDNLVEPALSVASNAEDDNLLSVDGSVESSERENNLTFTPLAATDNGEWRVVIY